MICREKAEYLVNLVEASDFSVEKVTLVSVAMAYVAKWELGMIHLRRL